MHRAETAYTRGQEIPGTGYEFVRVLGQGAQGIVYEVRDPYLDTVLVMKVLNAEHASGRRAAGRIQEEAQALAKLDSPNIVQVRRGGITSEGVPRPYFVMPKLQGDTLSAVLKRKGKLPLRDAVHIAVMVLDGLDVAHSHPTHRMVHRDIKPANIFIHRVSPHEVRAVILDFGIARLTDKVRSKKTLDSFVGTFEYAAPEQYGASELSGQTDIYAVGGILFHMIAGRLVFEASSRMDIGRKHLEEVAPRVAQFRDVPAMLDDLVASALEKDPFRRPRSAHAFAQALRAFDKIAEKTSSPASERTEEVAVDQLFGLAQKEDSTASVDSTLVDSSLPLASTGQSKEGGADQSSFAFRPTEMDRECETGTQAPRNFGARPQEGPFGTEGVSMDDAEGLSPHRSDSSIVSDALVPLATTSPRPARSFPFRLSTGIAIAVGLILGGLLFVRLEASLTEVQASGGAQVASPPSPPSVRQPVGSSVTAQALNSGPVDVQSPSAIAPVPLDSVANSTGQSPPAVGTAKAKAPMLTKKPPARDKVVPPPSFKDLKTVIRQ